MAENAILDVDTAEVRSLFRELSPRDSRYLEATGFPYQFLKTSENQQTSLDQHRQSSAQFTVTIERKILVLAAMQSPVTRVCRMYIAYQGIAFESIGARELAAVEDYLFSTLQPRVLEFESADYMPQLVDVFLSTGWELSARLPDDTRMFDRVLDRLIFSKHAG